MKTSVGLFAGIGGLELGLEAAGFETQAVVEIDEAARAVLRRHFSSALLWGDVCELRTLPVCDVLTAGFPCQDLSQAGRTKGIDGLRSSLVGEVFRLLRSMPVQPDWLVVENVPFMLQLQGGEAMRRIVESLEELGYAWAYRVVDAMAFGLPQRRRRVILVASSKHDPREVLFADESERPQLPPESAHAWGFYWTEGLRGLGLASDAVPTIKGGSGLGIPSPPAIVRRASRDVITPAIEDAERLQGFEAGWTEPAREVSRRAGARWKLVGNAVSTAVAKWVGMRLSDPRPCRSQTSCLGSRWPDAAFGAAGQRMAVAVTDWPVTETLEPILSFVEYEGQPLSARASGGFLSRTERSTLRFPAEFLEVVEEHRDRMVATR